MEKRLITALIRKYPSPEAFTADFPNFTTIRKRFVKSSIDQKSHPSEVIRTLIMAAGQGRRYGGAKQLHLIEGRPMLEVVVEQQIRLNRGQVTVVLGARKAEIGGVLDKYQVDVAYNPRWSDGMSTSIRAGVNWTKEHVAGASAILVVLADQPFITDHHFKLLISSHFAHPDHIIASGYQGDAGVPAIFPTKYWPLLLQLSGDQGAKALLRQLESVITIDIEAGAVDIDTP